MKKDRIQNDINLDFDVKVSVKEIKNYLDIYFSDHILDSNDEYKRTNDLLELDNRYIMSNGELAINVKWYFPKFHNSLYKKNDNEFIDLIHQTAIDAFWYKANIIAHHYGYACCIRDGRSDGWAKPMLKGKELNEVWPLKYYLNNTELEYLIKIKIFVMFAADIKNLFKMIDKEIQNVTNITELNELQNKIYDL